MMQPKWRAGLRSLAKNTYVLGRLLAEATFFVRVKVLWSEHRVYPPRRTQYVAIAATAQNR
jgi:hypothetical protein